MTLVSGVLTETYKQSYHVKNIIKTLPLLYHILQPFCLFLTQTIKNKLIKKRQNGSGLNRFKYINIFKHVIK